jgi:hypothetical protein
VRILLQTIVNHHATYLLLHLCMMAVREQHAATATMCQMVLRRLLAVVDESIREQCVSMADDWLADEHVSHKYSFDTFMNVCMQMVHTRVACRVYTALADEAGATPTLRTRLLTIIPLLCTQLNTVVHAAEGTRAHVSHCLVKCACRRNPSFEHNSIAV